MTFWPWFKTWCVLTVAVFIVIAICIFWLDVPIAQEFSSNIRRFGAIGRGLGSVVLISGEMLVVAILAIVRLAKGSLPIFAKALFVACCASLSAFVTNDYLLKFVFGRLNPAEFFRSEPGSVFHFFQGSYQSSFPSGHMVMATAFAMTLIRLEPRTRPFLLILLCIGAGSLLVGDWHFLADIIAGTFVGGTAGFIAGELWAEHIQRHEPSSPDVT
jgi:membrane-associated phospholipid phosphatase